MKYRTELFDFLCTLIDVQIKKYSSLATFGVGPDARLNAKLVFNEVEELLDFAKQLLSELKTPPDNITQFTTIFTQVKFYVEQEYVRAYAGWLLSENNIHSTVKERVAEQLDKLKEIGNLIEFDTFIPSKPITDVQKQCEYDSNAIAYRILDLAKNIATNPSFELDNKIPEHAQRILKNNATTRYVEFAPEINELHTKYDDFLKQSELEKSNTVLEADDAKRHATLHNDMLEKLLYSYNRINPASALFSPDYKPYKVGVNPSPHTEAQPLTKPNYSSNKLILFGTVGVVLICSLMQYFWSLSDEHKPTFKIEL